MESGEFDSEHGVVYKVVSSTELAKGTGGESGSEQGRSGYRNRR